MRALVYQNKRLTLENHYPEPSLESGEALIRVLLAGICNTDLEITRGYMAFEGVLGHEFVGIVESVHEGSGATAPTYLIGKRVVGEINAACHRADCFYCQRNMPTHCPRRTTLGIVNRDGAFAEYLTLPTANLHLVPDNVSDEEAVFVEPLAANFEIFEQVHVRPTDSVIVLGDGKMGQLAAQVLSLASCEVLMIGKHPEKLAIVQQRGIATHLLEDVTHLLKQAGRRVDLVVECTGAAQGLELALQLVRPRGTIILKSTVADRSALHLAPIVIDEIRVQGSRCGPFAPALRALSQRTIDARPLINARYPLDDALAAFKYAGQKGVLKVLVQVSEKQSPD
jgi:threonine dehydrogenase-like Zn-dependent dehydrogenase